LRYSNLYGDHVPAIDGRPLLKGDYPGPWAKHNNFWFTLFSFINCQKYPPSLLYLLMTLGPAITCMAIFDRDLGPVGRFLIVFGRVPLFYYLLHIPLIHALMVGIDYARYGWSPYASDAPWTIDRTKVPANYGYDLVIVYVVWAGVVLFLYPLCRWFAGIKARQRSAWLSYL
jgi:hypothetical protein